MQEYTLADLTTITGAKRRTVQLWAEAGVIKADADTERAGTGTHRRFSRKEAAIACMITPFARMQISIGRILGVSDTIRGLLAGKGNGNVGWQDIEDAIANRAFVYMVVSASPGGDQAVTLLPFDVTEPIESTFAEVGRAVASNEHENGAISIAMLLNSHLKNLA